METGLTTTEANQLIELECVIETGLKTFSEVGNALLAIRDGKLYRASHKTFEGYCKDRWGMVHRHANRLIAAAETAGHLGPVGPKPDAERQVRPLTRLPAADRPEAWSRAVDRAKEDGREKPTARDVEAVVAEIVNPKPQQKNEREELPKVRGVGVRLANDAIAILQKIPTADPLRAEGMETVMRWIKANK